MILKLKKQMLILFPFLFIIFFLSFLSLSGVFVHLNALIYDKTIELSLNKNTDNKPILLVELAPDDIDNFPQNFPKIINNIISLKPHSLIFLTNQKDNFSNIEKIQDQVPVFLATPLVYNSGAKKIYKPSYDDIPKNLKHLEGYIASPQIEVGTYRFDFDSYETIFGKKDSIARKIALRFSDIETSSEGKYYINFNNHTTLPKVSFKRLLNNGLIEELITDHHIIFGYEKRILEVGLNTPAIQNTGYLTVMQYFGYSLLTLLENNTIEYFNIYQEVLMMLFFLIVGLILHKILNIKYSILTVLFGFIVLYSITWILLDFFHIWIPVTEICVLIMLVSFLINWMNNEKRKKNESMILLSTAEQMRERISHKTFFNSDSYWDYVASLITQMLSLNKVILLEKVEHDHRLFEIKSIGCDFSDISEQRRDYEREPYISAINAREPIVVKDRILFKNLQEDEIQYVVPLLHSGQVLGFWIFTTNKATPNQVISFQNIIESFSSEISELLYQRLEWKLNQSNQKKSWFKFFSIISLSNTNKKIQETLTLIEKRLSLLETVINRIENGIVLYDMFGRVYHINKNMQELLTSIEVLPFNITGEDLISNLCDLSTQKSKTIFRHASMQQEPFVLEVKKTLKEGHSFLIKGVSISKDDLGENFNDTFLFDNYGILIEIIDITSFKEQVDLKTEVIKETNSQLKEQLKPILEEIIAKTDDNIHLKEQIDSFLFTFNKMEDIVSQDVFFGSKQYYPVDIKVYLQRVIKFLHQDLLDSLIETELNNKVNIGLAFVNPLNIQNILVWFMRFLIEDGIQDSKIYIDFEEEKHYVIIQMRNEGFGIPNDKFQEILLSNIEPDELIFKKLRESIKFIEKIGGKVISHSHHGEGVMFSVYLKKY